MIRWREPADLDAVALIDGADVLTNFGTSTFQRPPWRRLRASSPFSPRQAPCSTRRTSSPCAKRLTAMGIPCPRGPPHVEDESQLEEFGATVGWPLIVKTPRGVTHDGHGVAIARGFHGRVTTDEERGMHYEAGPWFHYGQRSDCCGLFTSRAGTQAASPHQMGG